ncbi:MAG: hypothetical protein DCC71_07200 [Proteobacteria bacterium]|nr:MAG: hypothetical protein DCC71_07200 [Pseudomonadota bacterium]
MREITRADSPAHVRSRIKTSQSLLDAFDAFTEESVEGAERLIGRQLPRLEPRVSLAQMRRLLTSTGKFAHAQFDPFVVATGGIREVSLSRAVGALLDPEGSHGLGNTVLLSLVRSLRGCARRTRTALADAILASTWTEVELELRGQEESRPDIEIRGSEYVIWVENKRKHGLETWIHGKAQTKRLYEGVHERARKLGLSSEVAVGIFLTP